MTNAYGDNQGVDKQGKECSLAESLDSAVLRGTPGYIPRCGRWFRLLRLCAVIGKSKAVEGISIHIHVR